MTNEVNKEIEHSIKTIPFGKKIVGGKSHDITTFKVHSLQKEFYDIFMESIKEFPEN